MVTIGHHTCRNIGGESHIRANAPFFAIHDESKGKKQFLGSGYYFWDNNLELAHTWGTEHYSGNYCIITANIDITWNSCFDLVGNREHQINCLDVYDSFEKKGYPMENVTICSCLEMLKNLAIHDPSAFPFKSIRAVDEFNFSSIAIRKIPFSSRHYTILNPKISICVIDKSILSNIKIIHL